MTPMPIYLDFQASTPVDPRVLDAMLPYLTDGYGNASSVQHEPGRQAARAVERARGRVADLLGARLQEVVFTSGATEANNLAVRGVADANDRPGHVVSCTTEHPAVLEPLHSLEKAGWAISYLGVDSQGEIDLEELRRSIRSDTVLVSLMTANNEIGTLHPIESVSAIAHEYGVLVHTDAAQAVGKIDLDVEKLRVDLLSLSAHKCYGPQGVGALFVRREVSPRIRPLLYGGGQENNLRSGTLNVAGIIGFGTAAEIARAELGDEAARLARQRDYLCELLLDGCPDARMNGASPPKRLPGSAHVTFPGTEADAVMANCPGVAMASGSACSSAVPGPSHVLRAIGMPAELAEASLRLSIGRFTTDHDIEHAAELILDSVFRVRRLMSSCDSANGVVAA